MRRARRAMRRRADAADLRDRRSCACRARYWPGDRSRLGEDVVERAGDDDLAAVLTRARTDVDDVVGDADGLLVVLDHDHGVAEVAQADERVDEALVVALVQPDRRLVEDVEDADQAAADLRRQPDPLRLSPGERRRRPVEAQVVEPDIEQEPKPLVDLLEHRARRSCRSRSDSSRSPRNAAALRDRQLAQLVDVRAADGDGERRGPEARAAACGARHLAHVALDLLAGTIALRRRRGAARAKGPRPRTRCGTSVGARTGCGSARARRGRRSRRARAASPACPARFHGVVVRNPNSSATASSTRSK